MMAGMLLWNVWLFEKGRWNMLNKRPLEGECAEDVYQSWFTDLTQYSRLANESAIRVLLDGTKP